MKFFWTVFFVIINYFSFAQTKQIEQKCALAVIDKVSVTLAKEGSYVFCGYGEMTVHRPTPYLDLEELEDVKRTLLTLNDISNTKLDSMIQNNKEAIQNKKREIMTKKLYPSYEIPTNFLVTDSNNIITFYRHNFFVNHTYKVKDANLVFSVQLTPEEAKTAEVFQKRWPIYDHPDKAFNFKASFEIFTFFEDGLVETNYDTSIFIAALDIIDNIKTNDDIDLDAYGQFAIEKWISQNRADIDKYKRKDFSYMLSLKDSNDVETGYRMYHKYTYQNKEGKREEDVIFFDFDNYFVVRSLTRVSPPFDVFFEKD